MKTRPIIVGVNGSPESVRAAIAALTIAKRVGVPCVGVCAEPDYQQMLITSDGPAVETVEIAAAAEEHDRAAVRQSLLGRVPDEFADAIETRHGSPAAVLRASAERHDAGLIVVGCRWHRGFDRLRGRLTRHLMSNAHCPVLVTDGASPNFERVLVALDLSWASTPAYEEARRWAELFGARLRVVHVIEPVPPLPFTSAKAQAAFAQDYLRADEELRRTGMWSTIDEHTAEKVVRKGDATTTIVNEVRTWRADLLVVASHGKGWVDRMLIGSTTDELMQAPPSMTLVVPATPPPLTLNPAEIEAECRKNQLETTVALAV